MRQLVSHYDLLCRAAHVRKLHVELFCEAGEATELRVSDRYTAVLYGIDDLERAARELCVRLAREVSRP